MTLPDGSVRSVYDNVDKWLREAATDRLDLKRREADTIFRRLGITFSVYTEGGDPERLIPFDIIPRVFGAEEWARLSQGAIQRVKGINAFIRDIYHDQEILRAGVVPTEQVLKNDQFRPEMRGIDVPRDIYAHIVGIDWSPSAPMAQI